jgi:hypothetical protein
MSLDSRDDFEEFIVNAPVLRFQYDLKLYKRRRLTIMVSSIIKCL